MDDASVILWFFWVLLAGGLALAWIVHSQRWRSRLKEQIAQLTARVYYLEQSLKALSVALAERAERPTEPAKPPLIAERQPTTPSAPPVQDAKPTAAPGAPLGTFPAPKVIASEPEGSVPPWTPAASNEPRPSKPSETSLPASYAPSPAPSSAVARARSILNLEETLGTNWLNKLGIIIFVIGIALFLAYELRALGPAGKIMVGYVTGVTLLGAGVFFERGERYRILARAGIGGGWALTFFTAYAMYHVPASRVLSSQGADLALMLAVAAVMVAHTLRYRSQVVTALAFLLAFSTVTISHVSVYSLSAGAVLALGLTVIVVRRRWFELEILGILASYANHYVWLRPIIEPMHGHHRPFPEFTASAGLLILYWAVFRASYLVRRVESRREESVSSAAALVNAFLLLGLMRYQSVHPEWAFWFLVFLGAAELTLGQSPTIRRRPAAFVVLSTLGVALLVAAFPFRYSGGHLSILWLMETEAVFLAGVFIREPLFRRLGTLASVVVAGQMLAVDATRVLGERWDGARVVNEPRLAMVFALAVLILYANAHWIPGHWPREETNRFFSVLWSRTSYVAAPIALAGAAIAWPWSWTAVAWSALALALAYAGRRFKIEALSVQANLVAGLAIARVLASNVHATDTYHHLTLRLITISIVAALLYLFSRWSILLNWVKAGRLPEVYLWSASSLVALVAWYELRPASVALGWALLGLVLFEVGMKERSTALRLQAYLALVASFVRILIVNLNAVEAPGQLSPRVYTIVPLALAYYYIYGRLWGREDDFLRRDVRLRAAELHCFLGTIAVAALMRFELNLDWVAAAWAALALILVTLEWRTERWIFLHQSYLMGFAVLFRTVLHNLYERSYFPAPFWRGPWVVVGTVVALLALTLVLASQLALPPPARDPEHPWMPAGASIERRPEQIFFFIPFVLLTWLLAEQLRHGLVTFGWGIEAVGVFLVALKVGQRSYRLSALGLLLLCVLKIALVDVWGLAPRDRYMTFIALGSALPLVSFLYSKYREVVREYL